MENKKPIDIVAQQAKSVSHKLAGLDSDTKNQLLQKISEKVRDRQSEIEKSNQEDIDAAAKMVESGVLTVPLLNRLKLTPDKINQLSTYLEEVAKLDDPVGRVQYGCKLDNSLELHRVSCPIGVVAIIFESRPEVVIQVTALSLKSGNVVILKGGREATNTNRMLFNIIEEVLIEFDLEHTVSLIETREDVSELLNLDRYIDLIIPRGSNEFVRYIQENTKIPVIGHSSGICHLYLDKDCDFDKAVATTLDSKLDYPSACNAVETLLIHEQILPTLFPLLADKLISSGVRLLGCDKTRAFAEKYMIPVDAASDTDWETEYTDLILSIRTVVSLEEAIAHINRYGSHHTDSIITENKNTAERFFQLIDSACVFHNTSTRFSDGFVFGLGAEVGISTNKTHARGPVGLEGMIIYKYILQGNGHVKGDYAGQNAKPFLHEPI